MAHTGPSERFRGQTAIPGWLPAPGAGIHVLKEGLHLLSLKPYQKPVTYILSKNKPVALQCCWPHLPSAVTLGWPFPVDSHQQDTYRTHSSRFLPKIHLKGKVTQGGKTLKWREWCLCALNQAITGVWTVLKRKAQHSWTTNRRSQRGITWTSWSRQVSPQCPGSSATGRGPRPLGFCWTRCRRPALL